MPGGVIEMVIIGQELKSKYSKDNFNAKFKTIFVVVSLPLLFNIFSN